MANDWREYIAADPQVMLGKPVVRGTRITVEPYLALGPGLCELHVAKLIRRGEEVLPSLGEAN